MLFSNSNLLLFLLAPYYYTVKYHMYSDMCVWNFKVFQYLLFRGIGFTKQQNKETKKLTNRKAKYFCKSANHIKFANERGEMFVLLCCKSDQCIVYIVLNHHTFLFKTYTNVLMFLRMSLILTMRWTTSLNLVQRRPPEPPTPTPVPPTPPPTAMSKICSILIRYYYILYNT